MRIDFLYWEDCPSHPDALARLRQVLIEEAVSDDIQIIRIDTQEDAERHRFPGSPTIRFDGVDLQPEGVQGQAMLTCRTYRTEIGRLSPLPTAAMIRHALHTHRQSPKKARRHMMTLALSEGLIPFSLPATDGKPVSPEQYKNTPVLGVVFWCNHCPYVKAWESRMIALQKEYAGRGVQFVLISSNDPIKYPDDSFDAMKTLAREKGYPFPYVFDESQDVARAYGATRTPEVFLFDRTRVLRYHGAPDDNFEDPDGVKHHYLKDAIEAVLAGRTPATPDTAPRGCTIKWKG
jgi:peroxiredoxin